MKKVIYGIIAVVLIGIIFFINSNTKTNKAYYIQDSIRSGDVNVLDSRNGETGEGLENSEVEKLLDQFKDYEFKWKIDLRPSGGWSYSIDLEIDDEVYRIVFYGTDYLKIDGDKFIIIK